jgi:hypothetical protein
MSTRLEDAVRSPTAGTPPPNVRYFRAEAPLCGVATEGRARLVESGGRTGVLASSIHTVFNLEAGHTLDAARGALTFWVLPMEDLRPGVWWGHFVDAEPTCDRYPLLTTGRDRRDLTGATFSLAWQQFWWRPLMARFCARHPETHFRWWSHFGPCEFHFEAGRWRQLGLAWDREARTASLFVDGVCVGRTDSWKRPIFDVAGPDLYAGSTAFALGELAFYEGAWTDGDFAEAFVREDRRRDEGELSKLRATHAGEGCVREACPPPDDYVERLALSLTEPAQIERFYVQGNTAAPRITPEGLLVETPQGSPPLPEEKRDAEDKLQVYLHTWDSFEGELYLEFEFKALAHEGLGLVMVQAQGMQREDFMRDHPLRTTGSMRMVCWENVRNYHWEFFREMEGIRNDVATHAFMKNPYFRGLAYQTMPERLALDTWHRVQLRQDGGRWRGYVDGVRVFDVSDEVSAHAGPIYAAGRIALRNMRNTRMLWRNLRVMTRPTPWRSTPL